MQPPQLLLLCLCPFFFPPHFPNLCFLPSLPHSFAQLSYPWGRVYKPTHSPTASLSLMSWICASQLYLHCWSVPWAHLRPLAAFAVIPLCLLISMFTVLSSLPPHSQKTCKASLSLPTCCFLLLSSQMLFTNDCAKGLKRGRIAFSMSGTQQTQTWFNGHNAVWWVVSWEPPPQSWPLPFVTPGAFEGLSHMFFWHLVLKPAMM